ncbi:TRAP transporter substrate-binding protein [Desulforhopalus vacuolatus]|uniref:TRAP transporter substrate-binding protein n=1 Tax=Desulforhopalus vacuolatus TaxID=40414 RepID=UPI0019631CF3|nr:TRAP transporter substrate-binding protein [Desulforhopalus vacuolatus]MBM9520831.1 TRAP transporter substrate-binding protein [Desulforhopalus vacuolatus]
MRFSKNVCLAIIFVLLNMFVYSTSFAKEDPLEEWSPSFDPSKAQYVYLLSCVGHPAIEGVAVGFKIRDRLWKETDGKIYVDFRPLSQLGGEKDVINKLKFGAIQGMMSSSVAAANIAPVLGIVNLPYVVDSFEKLEKFRSNEQLWKPYQDAALSKGLQVLDFTGYGSYGWATTKPVATREQAQGVNFRIAQAPVNIDIYKAWNLKFSVLPWPDVPQALQTGVIDGLDHTPIVCNISKKFTVAKYYTQLDYAQGLYVHIINKRWLDKLPPDLQEIFLRVVKEESAITRKLTIQQQEEQIAAAKKDGVTFYELSKEDKAAMIKDCDPVYDVWGKKIGKKYLEQVQNTL